MKAAILALMAAFGAVMPAWADEAQLKKYKDYTPEQIRSLSEKERESSVPMLYTMAAQRGLAIDAKLAFTADLNTLMYPAISDYEGSIKAFQKDMGEKPTGVLTVWQIAKLEERAQIQKLKPVAFPDNFYSYITPDTAHIEGTNVMFDERLAWPINHVKVTCYKADAYCEVNTLVLATPNDNSWAQQYQVMEISSEIYKITRWENDNIDGVMATTPDACRTSSINYNFKAKEFFGTTRNTGNECKFSDVMPKLPKPRITQIIEGKKVIGEEFAKIQQKAYGYLSSDFRKQVDEMEKQYSSKAKKQSQ
jgi:hypothetical protein